MGVSSEQGVLGTPLIWGSVQNQKKKKKTEYHAMQKHAVADVALDANVISCICNWRRRQLHSQPFGKVRLHERGVRVHGRGVKSAWERG